MNHAKIKISEEELRIASDPEIILTKNRIIQKVYEIFGNLADKYQKITSNTTLIPEEILHRSPKISKGENYLELPYVILDFPKYFSAENIFAIRTMFWWGHYFSITLHLKGIYKQRYQSGLSESFHMLLQTGGDWWLQSGPDEWQHHKNPATHLEISNIDPESWANQMSHREFLKLACYIPLKEWNEAEKLLLKYFTELIQLLKN